MADKLLISLVNVNPENMEEITFPLIQAIVAVSMEYSVEVIFSGRAGCLGIKNYAKEIIATDGSNKTVADFIKEAYDAGVVFKISTPALETWGDALISEVDEIVGSTYLISEAMDDDTVTFTY